jgi:hypothetical protein
MDEATKDAEKMHKNNFVIRAPRSLSRITPSGLLKLRIKFQTTKPRVSGTPWVGDRPVARPLSTHTGQHNTEERGGASMPRGETRTYNPNIRVVQDR